MNLLLDTHIFLWWNKQDPALDKNARAAITNAKNQVFVSAASIREIAIKKRVGKLQFQGSGTGAIGANGFHELAILPMDAENAGSLEWSHNDPFDRMLVVQARRVSLTLVTADKTIRAFGGLAQLWAG